MNQPCRLTYVFITMNWITIDSMFSNHFKIIKYYFLTHEEIRNKVYVYNCHLLAFDVWHTIFNVFYNIVLPSPQQFISVVLIVFEVILFILKPHTDRWTEVIHFKHMLMLKYDYLNSRKNNLLCISRKLQYILCNVLKYKTVQWIVQWRHYTGRHLEIDVNIEIGICVCFILMYFPFLF